MNLLIDSQIELILALVAGYTHGKIIAPYTLKLRKGFAYNSESLIFK